MQSGYYVGRRPTKRRSNKFVILESRPFVARSDSDDDQWRARQSAWSWGEFIQKEHPKDEVFVFQVFSLEEMEKSLDD